ncbi:43211_t:CDS:2, partial [Gigaspora margarita]
SQNVAKPVKRKSQTSISQYLYRPLANNIQQQFEQHLIRGTVVNGLPFKWIQDDDIVAAFKLVNPAIQLLSRHILSRSILKKENLAIKNISVIGIVSDSAEENVKSQKELRTQYTNIAFLPCFAHQANLCVGDIFKSSERYREVSNQAIKITTYALTSPCVTRWNSFYNSFHSILKSKGALTVILTILYYITNMENSANLDDKKFPSDIANIINDSIFWNNLKELDEILLPFCVSLNKLQCKSAHLYDIMHAYAWIVDTSQKQDNSLFRSHILLHLKRQPENILLELEDFLANNSLFDTIPFNQFHDNIIKYWSFVK